MYIIIIGCSRLGAKLANYLSSEGHEITIIDPDKNSFKRLDDNFNGKIINGTGIDFDILKQAEAHRADVFIAATNWDNTNLLASQIAKEKFKIPKIILRLYDPERAAVYEKFGFTIFCPTIIGFEFIKEKIF